jgi:hypothetical protein
VLFLPGITLGADKRAVAPRPPPRPRRRSTRSNKLREGDRPAAVLQWQWTTAGGPDANDEQDFLDGFKGSVESTWRAQHPFHCTRRYWEDVGATTEIKVEVAKVSAATDKTAGAFGNVMNVTSEDVVPRHDELLRRNVCFQRGKGLLTPGSVGTVWRLAK